MIPRKRVDPLPCSVGLLLVLCLGTGCAGIHAYDAPERGGHPWLSLQSQHFTLQTDLDRDDAVRALDTLEHSLVAMEAMFWEGAPRSQERIRAVILRSELELREWAGDHVGGYMRSGRWQHTLVLGGPQLGWAPVAAHEVMHVLEHRALIHPPAWVDEGLASYVESLSFDRDTGVVTFGNVQADRLKSVTTRAEPLALSVLWKGPPLLDHRSGADRFYASSWLLVHRLINAHPAPWHAFLTALEHGTEPQAAWAAAFPGFDDAKVADELDSALHGGRYERSQLRIRSTGVPPPVSGLTPAEVHALRAELFLPDPRFHREGLAELDAALAIDPASPEALALLGQAKRAEATERQARAATGAHPENPTAWKLLARVLGRPTTAAQPRERAEALERAIALAPQDLEPLVQLGFARLTAHELRSAEQLFNRARAIAPMHPAVLALGADLAFSKRDCQTAASLIDDVVQRGMPDPQWLGTRRRWLADGCPELGALPGK